MPPKADAKGKGKGEIASVTPLLEALFPVWTDAGAADKEPTDKYEDIAGVVLPPETQQYLDTWKRPEDLVQNMPNLPIVVTKPVDVPADDKAAKGAKGAPPPVSREFEGKLFAGHKTFEWLQGVFNAVISLQKTSPPGSYLWELIHPRDPKDNTHIKPPSGKYRIKLFIMDTWRTVVVDDRIPVDLFGRSLLVGVIPIALWPLLLSKAVVKVMAALRVTGLALPHQVAAFSMLTGWPHEDLLDPLSGAQLPGGFLFDRLEDSVRGNDQRAERRAVATVCLKDRAVPPKPPPRIIVLTGPSAVGRAALMQRLVAEFPDRFGLTVSHTSRPPREHEVHGQDYQFVSKSQIRALQQAGDLLEYAPVSGASGRAAGRAGKGKDPWYMYGTSISTVREVAATGKLCVMGIEQQGVEALRANKRIDGLYIYCAPPSLDELERRIRGRLKEAAATVEKRLTWAVEQTEQASKPGLFDHFVSNDQFADVYHSLKEAISTLSPIIRNRLRGLPAYVLDYSDLIPPNQVEKPFLKPVLVSGPTAGERQQLMEQLVTEFPDVFAFPRLTTTRPTDEALQHALTPEELEVVREERQASLMAAAGRLPGSRSASPSMKVRVGSGASPVEGEEEEEQEEEEAGGAEEEEPGCTYPEPIYVSEADFDAAAASGQLLEQHKELFKHPMVSHKVGVSAEAIREVIKSGKLPLLEVEVEGVSSFKQRGIDCLTIFLQPLSQEEFKTRLVGSLTETDEEVAARMKLAEAQMTAASSSSLYDYTLVNDELDTSYQELKGLISQLRPDVIPPVDEAAAAAAEAECKQPVLVLAGPNTAGKAALAAQLVQAFPNTFAIPGQVTDRKPAKGQVSTDELTFVSGKDFAKMAAENQLLVQWAAEGGSLAVTLDALKAVTSTNKVAMLELPETAAATAVPTLKASTAASGALYVFVASAAVNATGTPPLPEAALQAAVDDASASGLYHLVCSEGGCDDLQATVRDALCSHVPDIVRPPYKPLVITAPFGTGARQLLQELFLSLPGAFASPLVTTTKPSTQPDVDERGEMHVVSSDQAAALTASGAFLFSTTALGHTYGVQLADVRRIQASGKVCVIEVDTVATAEKLKSSGFEANYVFVGVSSMDELLKRVHTAVVDNPPLGYEPDEAAAKFFSIAKSEMAASRTEGLFDAWVENTADADASFSRLAETVHKAYPDVVVPQFVYGFGRGLWDPDVRCYGQHPLKVMVLGPAGSGKSTQCALLAQQFDLPHINVGDLLYEEIKAGTPLGLEAKQWADASKTVPDRLFLQMLTKRLAEPDCAARGWLLDGFPHTASQAVELRTRGIEPDKVVFLQAENAILMDRTRFRRVDMDTGAIYHMPEPGALSPAIQPLTPAGQLDTVVVARLHPRHDDSEENVEARLALWDEHVRALREAYEDVSLRVAAAGTAPEDITSKLAAFLSLEATITDIQVINSTTLKELQYEVVDTLRYRRSQLVRLLQFDGKTFWVDSKELAYNSHCVLLARDPTSFPVVQQLSRLDLTSVARIALVWVNSPEPAEVLVTLSLGPQAPLEDNPEVPPRVLVMCGPLGAGRATLTQHLLDDYPDRVALVQPWTTRPPLKGEQDGNPMFFTDSKSLQTMLVKGQLAGHVISEHDGQQYAVRLDALQLAWSEGKLPVVIGPHALAVSLKEAAVKLADEAGASLSATSTPGAKATPPPLIVQSMYVTADLESLDVRLRQEWQLEEQHLQHQLTLAVQEEASVRQAVSDHQAQLQAAQAAVTTAQAAAAQAAAAATTTKGGDAGAAAAQQALASAAAALAAASLPPPTTPDYLISNTGRAALMIYQQVKEAVSKLWHKPRNAVACQVLLESYDWRVAAPGTTRQRLRTVTLSGGTLELPRGQHLLRVTAASDYPHTIALYSVPPCKREQFFCRADELSVVMKEMCDTLQGKEGTAKAVVTTLSGTCEVPGPDKTVAVLRYNLQVSEATQITGSLSIPREQLRAITRMLLVDNTTGEEVHCTSGRLPLTELIPQPAGYTLLAVASAPGVSTTSSPPAAEESAVPWVVQLMSSAPLSACQETSVARTQEQDGTYTPNSRCILACYLLTPIQAMQLALRATTQPALPCKLSICAAPTGGEVVWGTAYPELLQRSSSEGEPLLVSKALEPGKYLVMLELDREVCPAGWQPDPVTGAIAGPDTAGDASRHVQSSKPVSWRLTFMPSADDKVCPITLDDSQVRSFKAMQEQWNAAGVAMPAAPGGKPGAPAAKPAAGKPGAGVSGRAAAAAALLDKVVADLGGSQAATAGAGVTPVKRALKDGSSVELAPDAHLRVASVAAEPQVLGEQHLMEQVAKLEEQLGSVPAVSGRVVGVLTAGKEVCQSTKAKRLEEFGAWRRDAASSQQELLQKRAAAVLMAKQTAAPTDTDKLPAVAAQ